MDPVVPEGVEQPAYRLGEEWHPIGPPGLGGLAEARQVEGDDGAMWDKGRDGVAPGLGECAQAVDQHRRGPAPGGRVVELQPVDRASRETNQRHLSRGRSGAGWWRAVEETAQALTERKDAEQPARMNEADALAEGLGVAGERVHETGEGLDNVDGVEQHALLLGQPDDGVERVV